MKLQLKKIICDSIHGQITLHPLCISIIDTIQFQRLRHIKQLAIGEYVFPGATHNRFSHSIGVSYLAGRYIRHLQEAQPELKITQTQILCLEIAGLCHDLGHGPFSHLWEMFMNHPSNKLQLAWKHELASVNILEHLIEDNGLISEFRNYGLDRSHIEFIKNIILGIKNGVPEQAFLFQIVNNEDSGLDVDKWDYYLRDSYHCGIPCRLDYKRLVKFARVININGQNQICFRDKETANVCDMFRIRADLHSQIYQHRVSFIMEEMLCEALIKSESQLIGPDGKLMKFYEWSMKTQDIEKKDQYYDYYKLTDTAIWNSLLYSSNSTVKKIVQFLLMRSKVHLPQVLDMRLIKDNVANHNYTKEKFYHFLKENGVDIDEDLLIIKSSKIHWGKGPNNPLDSVFFFSKSTPHMAQKYSTENTLLAFPNVFEEKKQFLICKSFDQDVILTVLNLWKIFCQI